MRFNFGGGFDQLIKTSLNSQELKIGDGRPWEVLLTFEKDSAALEVNGQKVGPEKYASDFPTFPSTGDFYVGKVTIAALGNNILCIRYYTNTSSM